MRPIVIGLVGPNGDDQVQLTRQPALRATPTTPSSARSGREPDRRRAVAARWSSTTRVELVTRARPAPLSAEREPADPAAGASDDRYAAGRPDALLRPGLLRLRGKCPAEPPDVAEHNPFVQLMDAALLFFTKALRFRARSTGCRGGAVADGPVRRWSAPTPRCWPSEPAPAYARSSDPDLPPRRCWPRPTSWSSCCRRVGTPSSRACRWTRSHSRPAGPAGGTGRAAHTDHPPLRRGRSPAGHRAAAPGCARLSRVGDGLRAGRAGGLRRLRPLNVAEPLLARAARLRLIGEPGHPVDAGAASRWCWARRPTRCWAATASDRFSRPAAARLPVGRRTPASAAPVPRPGRRRRCVGDGAVPPCCLAYERNHQAPAGQQGVRGRRRPTRVSTWCTPSSTRAAARPAPTCSTAPTAACSGPSNPPGGPDAGWPAVKVLGRSRGVAGPAWTRTPRRCSPCCLQCLANRLPMVLASRDAERAAARSGRWSRCYRGARSRAVPGHLRQRPRRERLRLPSPCRRSPVQRGRSRSRRGRRPPEGPSVAVMHRRADQPGEARLDRRDQRAGSAGPEPESGRLDRLGPTRSGGCSTEPLSRVPGEVEAPAPPARWSTACWTPGPPGPGGR